MKRVLVTGGTGFIGANLVRRCLSLGHEVHLLVREGFSPWRVEAVREELRFHEADMASGSGLEAAVRRAKPDWVFHMAAHGGYSWQTDRDEIFRTNFLGAVNLMDACAQIGCEAFVQAGSSSEYGFKDHAPTEIEGPEPNSYYAVAKASATLHCGFVARNRGLPSVTLRLYSVYGPYEDPRRLIPTLVRCGLEGRLPPLVNPEIGRDFLYVEDAVEAFIMVAESGCPEPGGIYNVGTGVQTTLRGAVDVAREAFDLSEQPRWGTMQDRVWDTNIWLANSRKIAETLGWAPKTNFRTGFETLIEWVRNGGGDAFWARCPMFDAGQPP